MYRGGQGVRELRSMAPVSWVTRREGLRVKVMWVLDVARGHQLGGRLLLWRFARHGCACMSPGGAYSFSQMGGCSVSGHLTVTATIVHAHPSQKC